VLNPNQELGPKLDGTPHKLALKYIISTIKTQVDGDTKTLDFLNSENNPNLVQFDCLF
jgi:hypothetical protein